jgi:anti-sigma-K factor RskA
MTKQDSIPASLDLAGEYVLGTLQGKAREAFVERLKQDTELQLEVAAWERRMAPLLDAVEPVDPPAAVWTKIEQHIDPQPASQASAGLWNNLRFWRGLSMVAATLVLVLGLSLLGLRYETAQLQQLMVVLNQQSQAGWLVASRDNAGFLQVSAVEPTPLPADKVCQLWLVTEAGAMLPVGVLPHTGSTQLRVPALLKQNSRFKVSIESASHAPVERPSQEIVFEGKLTKI